MANNPLTIAERQQLREQVAVWTKFRDLAAEQYARVILVDCAHDRRGELLNEFRIYDAAVRALRVVLGEPSGSGL